jgi:hypothetical protein
LLADVAGRLGDGLRPLLRTVDVQHVRRAGQRDERWSISRSVVGEWASIWLRHASGNASNGLPPLL